MTACWLRNLYNTTKSSQQNVCPLFCPSHFSCFSSNKNWARKIMKVPPSKFAPHSFMYFWEIILNIVSASVFGYWVKFMRKQNNRFFLWNLKFFWVKSSSLLRPKQNSIWACIKATHAFYTSAVLLFHLFIILICSLLFQTHLNLCVCVRACVRARARQRGYNNCTLAVYFIDFGSQRT